MKFRTSVPDAKGKTRAHLCLSGSKTFSKTFSLRKLPCPASLVVIDGRPIASENIIEESEPVNIVLDNLACVVSFNIISIPKIALFWDYHGSNYITQT